MISKTERKICGTCEFWTGKREPTFDKNSTPKINIIDKEGLCMNSNSRQYDKVRRNDLNCNCFSKWTEIL